MHALAAMEPLDATYFPLAQFSHCVEPDVLLYFPAGHVTHSVIALIAYRPFAHVTHLTPAI
jgi:hypothetical protein